MPSHLFVGISPEWLRTRANYVSKKESQLRYVNRNISSSFFQPLFRRLIGSPGSYACNYLHTAMRPSVVYLLRPTHTDFTDVDRLQHWTLIQVCENVVKRLDTYRQVLNISCLVQSLLHVLKACMNCTGALKNVFEVTFRDEPALT